MTIETDFLVIGAGSAGCAMAYRLSEDANHDVKVIEFGGSDIGPLIQMPAALSIPMNMSRYDWGYNSEPEPHLGGRRMHTPRGKVIGGSSSINGMVYVRGHAGDYDHWNETGAQGWAYADVLPYFKRMESWHDGGHGGDKDWRGQNGPLHVSRGPRKNPLYDAFVQAGAQAGFELTPDYNGQKQEGFGPMEMTVYKGRRWSSANAYLRPALKRSNCSLHSGLVERLIFTNKRCIGAEVRVGGKLVIFKARREVILAAGSINSPKLLMLSGVGPGSHLQEFGIPVVAERPGVGQNLQDHLELYIQQECLQPISLYSKLNWFSKLQIGAQWLFTKTGHGATNHFESAAFLRSKSGVKYPDIQYHFLPVAIRYDGKSPAKAHGFQAHVGPMRSKSRGSVTLASTDPAEAPKIQFNYMSHPDDWQDFRHCIRLTRDIFSQAAFDPFRGREIAPGEDKNSDEQLDEFIAEAVESAYHPSGTCKMGGVDDPMAVVDPVCQVIGVEGLRVADSSIFPRIPNGNLNGPSIMVGEKASDHILGNDLLPRSNEEPWINPRWQISDR